MRLRSYAVQNLVAAAADADAAAAVALTMPA
jgi:hypothetical protein